MPFPSYREVLLDHSGAVKSSATTSLPCLIADYGQLSMSVLTVTTFASLVTVQGTNVDGFTTTIPDGAWSTITTLTGGNQVVTIDPGLRWIRVASASSCTVVISARVR